MTQLMTLGQPTMDDNKFALGNTVLPDNEVQVVSAVESCELAPSGVLAGRRGSRIKA